MGFGLLHYTNNFPIGKKVSTVYSIHFEKRKKGVKVGMDSQLRT